MELKINNSKTTVKKGLKAIQKKLSSQFPDYAKLKKSHSVRANADWILCEKGLLSETDLLNIYIKAMAVDPFDETDLIEPQKNELINIDYLTSNCCIPYAWSEEGMSMLVCDPYHLEHHAYVFKRFFNLDISFTFVRRSIVERFIDKIYIEDKKEDNLVFFFYVRYKMKKSS